MAWSSATNLLVFTRKKKGFPKQTAANQSAWATSARRKTHESSGEWILVSHIVIWIGSDGSLSITASSAEPPEISRVLNVAPPHVQIKGFQQWIWR